MHVYILLLFFIVWLFLSLVYFILWLMYVYIPHLRNDTEFRAILFDGYTDYS